MKQVRYGVIGIKGIGQRHIRLAQQNEQVELTALVDVDPALVNTTSKELGVQGFTDYRDVLDAGVVDAVSIATPHHLHGIVGLDCLQAGVHVFIEKPFANRVSEADAMVAVAEEKNLKICVGHQYRTYRSPQAMKQLIDTGAIGKILRVLWTWIEFRPERYYTRDVWRATWQHAGGGVLMNQASHDLDLICWLIGRPVQVSALIGNQLHEMEVEDVAIVNIIFDNGAFGAFQFTINQPRGYSIRQIAGTKGTIVIQDVKSLTGNKNDQILLGVYEDSLPSAVTHLSGSHDQPGISWQSLKLPHNRSLSHRLSRKLDRIVLKRSAKSGVLSRHTGLIRKGNPTGHAGLVKSFIRAIIDDKEPVVTGKSVLPTVELVNAIILSAVRKKTVDLPLDRAEYDELFAALSQGQEKVPTFC